VHDQREFSKFKKHILDKLTQRSTMNVKR
jgi:hypothetical protein